MTHPASPAYDELMAQGMAASQASDSTQAIALLTQASEAAPHEALPQFLLGAEFASISEFTQAESAFANATRLAPGFPMARYQLGLLQFSSGRAAMALLTWQPLLQLPESDPLPNFVAGFDALARDLFDDALAHFQRGIGLNTSNEALNQDIEKVMAGIRNLAAPSSPKASETSEAHILLAGYQPQGPSH